MVRKQGTKTASVVSLLDRFTERPLSDVAKATLNRGESPESDLEAAIFRDLCWLLHTTSLAASRDLSRWPNVSRSVLNFGVDALAGKTLDNGEVPAVERAIKRAILAFEPRLRKETVRVQAIPEDKSRNSRVMAIYVSGEYDRGDSIDLFEIRALLDMETGRIEMKK